MSKVEDPDLHINLTADPNIDISPLSTTIRERIALLETAVQEASRIHQEQEGEALEGTDGGLYGVLTEVALGLGYRVEDNDEITKEILRDGRRGLNKQFMSGWILMIKQGSSLQMSATLSHELAHRFTPRIEDEQSEVLSETIAEGTAFVVCDHFGLDISNQAFPHIASYNKGQFTPEMRAGIETVSSWMISRVHGDIDEKSKS